MYVTFLLCQFVPSRAAVKDRTPTKRGITLKDVAIPPSGFVMQRYEIFGNLSMV